MRSWWANYVKKQHRNHRATPWSLGRFRCSRLKSDTFLLQKRSSRIINLNSFNGWFRGWKDKPWNVRGEEGGRKVCRSSGFFFIGHGSKLVFPSVVDDDSRRMIEEQTALISASGECNLLRGEWRQRRWCTVSVHNDTSRGLWPLLSNEIFWKLNRSQTRRW